MWKKTTLFMMLFVFLCVSQISCREHELTQQEKDFFVLLSSGKSEEIARLIEAGTNIRIKDQHGNTPLHLVSLRGDCESIKLLLSKGAKINSTDNSGDTPLHEASMNGHLEAAKLLISKNANVNAKNKQGENPIFPAAESGNLELVKLLVSKGAKIPKTGYTPLHSATDGIFRSEQVTSQHRDMIEYFLSYGIDINTKGNSGYCGTDVTVLHSAARSCDEAIIELLIEKGAHVNARAKTGKTPLFIAAMAGNKGAAKALLANGANVNARDDANNTPLHFTVRENNMATFSSIEGRIGLIQLLLDHGADVNAQNNSQYTPFHNSVGWGWFKQPLPIPEAAKYKSSYKTIIQMLLEKGADPNVKDKSGRTPLKLAEGESEIIELLIKYGAKD